MEHTIGLVLGVASGAAVGLVLVTQLFRKQVLDFHFDERQERARGKAYRNGFLTLIACVLVWGGSIMAGPWCDGLTGAVLCISVSLAVFAASCIWQDAYLGLRERPGAIFVVLSMVAAGNLALGAVFAADGGLVENGLLTYRACNLILGGMAAVILAVFTAKRCRDRSRA